jgi:excisionase family DNA binding protein
MAKMNRGESLTTGDIARMYGVSARTVAKWIDNKWLKGFKIPGSEHRRVSHANLIAFAKRHNLPFTEFVDDAAPKPVPS